VPYVPAGNYLDSAQLGSEAPNALIATLESVVGDQILPDCHGIAISTQTQLDDFPVGFTGARRAHTRYFLAVAPCASRAQLSS
jgi:hypothetical protein